MHSTTYKLQNPFLKSSPFRPLQHNYSRNTYDIYPNTSLKFDQKPTHDYSYAKLGYDTQEQKNPFWRPTLIDPHGSRVQSFIKPNQPYKLDHYEHVSYNKVDYSGNIPDTKSDNGSTYTYINKIYDLQPNYQPKNSQYEKLQNPFNRKYLITSTVSKNHEEPIKYSTNYKYDVYQSNKDYDSYKNSEPYGDYSPYPKYSQDYSKYNKFENREYQYKEKRENKGSIYGSNIYEEEIRSDRNNERKKFNTNDQYPKSQQVVDYQQPIFGGYSDENSPIKGFSRKAASQYNHYIAQNDKKEQFQDMKPYRKQQLYNQDGKLRKIVSFENDENQSVRNYSPPNQNENNQRQYPQILQVKGMLYHRIDIF